MAPSSWWMKACWSLSRVINAHHLPDDLHYVTGCRQYNVWDSKMRRHPCFSLWRIVHYSCWDDRYRHSCVRRVCAKRDCALESKRNASYECQYRMRRVVSEGFMTCLAWCLDAYYRDHMLGDLNSKGSIIWPTDIMTIQGRARKALTEMQKKGNFNESIMKIK